VRGIFAARPPHPILDVASTEPLSPRSAGRGHNNNDRISHHFSDNTSSFPRRVFAPGVLPLCFAHPQGRGGGAPRDVRMLARHPLGLHYRAGQAPSEAPCVPIRGTPASRRSHRGDFGRRGRASPHRHCGRIGHSELPHPGRSARRGAPASRGDGCESPPRDATPRSVLRIVSRARPLLSKARAAVV
jgi:hypothetical protein